MRDVRAGETAPSERQVRAVSAVGTGWRGDFGADAGIGRLVVCSLPVLGTHFRVTRLSTLRVQKDCDIGGVMERLPRMQPDASSAWCL